MEIDIRIDRITDCLVDVKTEENHATETEEISSSLTKALARSLKSDGWRFDWASPQLAGCQIIALRIKDDPAIQGLIAFRDEPDSLFTFVELVESAPWNIGEGKRYEGVGPHLFAIACKHSFEMGYEGYVQFVSKTDLVFHYINSLRARQITDQKLYLDTPAAEILVFKYYKDYYQQNVCDIPEVKDSIYKFDDYVKDGIYVIPSGGVTYDLRAMIKRVEELGRILTEEEAEEFVIKK